MVRYSKGATKISLGTELKAIMEKEGITGYRLSKETGIGESHINRILHNRHYPNSRTLKRILDVLGYRICFEKITNPSQLKSKRREEVGRFANG